LEGISETLLVIALLVAFQDQGRVSQGVGEFGVAAADDMVDTIIHAIIGDVAVIVIEDEFPDGLGQLMETFPAESIQAVAPGRVEVKELLDPFIGSIPFPVQGLDLGPEVIGVLFLNCGHILPIYDIMSEDATKEEDQMILRVSLSRDWTQKTELRLYGGSQAQEFHLWGTVLADVIRHLSRSVSQSLGEAQFDETAFRKAVLRVLTQELAENDPGIFQVVGGPNG